MTANLRAGVSVVIDVKNTFIRAAQPKILSGFACRHSRQRSNAVGVGQAFCPSTRVSRRGLLLSQHLSRKCIQVLFGGEII